MASSHAKHASAPATATARLVPRPGTDVGRLRLEREIAALALAGADGGGPLAHHRLGDAGARAVGGFALERRAARGEERELRFARGVTAEREGAGERRRSGTRLERDRDLAHGLPAGLALRADLDAVRAGRDRRERLPRAVGAEALVDRVLAGRQVPHRDRRD